MPLDAIPPDQRAVLQLVLQQGRSYEDLAGLLGIETETVRRRAHDALATLGPAAGIDPADQARVGDYLLGQLPDSDVEATRDLLTSDAGARTWAEAVSAEVSELAPDGLPEIPSEAATEPDDEPKAEDEPDDERDAEPVAARDRSRDREPEPDFAGEDETPYGYFPDEPSRSRTRTRPDGRPSSRLGGAIVLAGVGIILAVVLILVLSGGNDNKSSDSGTTSSTASTPATGTSGTSGGSGATGTSGVPDPIAQIQLRAADGTKAVGLAQVFARGNQRAVIVAGQGIKPGAYALWLYNSKSDSRLLGFVPSRVGTDGRFVTQGALPTGAAKFKEMVVTRENVSGKNPALPKQPGAIVLRGTLKGVSQ
jgi:hypothetical protein